MLIRVLGRVVQKYRNLKIYVRRAFLKIYSKKALEPKINIFGQYFELPRCLQIPYFLSLDVMLQFTRMYYRCTLGLIVIHVGSKNVGQITILFVHINTSRMSLPNSSYFLLPLTFHYLPYMHGIYFHITSYPRRNICSSYVRPFLVRCTAVFPSHTCWSTRKRKLLTRA